MTAAALAAATLPASAAAQQMGGMPGMEMHMPAKEGSWRMPPMDPNMPMLPGLGDALPKVSPFLPGWGVDVASLPEARPSTVVDMADGDTLDLTVSLVRRTLRGHDYVMYGYNQEYPGPLLRAPRGATLVVRVKNEIDLPTTVHWHGVRIDNRFDGVPGLTQDYIQTGGSFTYQVHVPDDGVYWYHPHAREDIQQDLGLYGNILVVGDPDDYGPVNREEMLVLDDLLVDDDGLIPFGKEGPTQALMGRFGTLMLTNGEADYHLTARKGEVIRFYMTNTANARTFNVRFGDQPVKLVGSDIGRYERERWVPGVVIAPAERYIVEARFDHPGTVAITNTIQAINHFRGEFYPHVDTLALVTVSDEAASPDLSAAWNTLRENEDVEADIERYRPLFDKAPDKTLVTTVEAKGLPIPIILAMEADSLYKPPLEFMDDMPMMNWLSSSEDVRWILREESTGAEDEDIHWTFHTGDVIKIRLYNDPTSLHPMNHPIHIHGQRFLVVDRDGVRQENLAWKDTAILPVGSTMDLLVELSNPGQWMVHCHIAEHLHAGMHFHFTVEGESTVGQEGG